MNLMRIPARHSLPLRSIRSVLGASFLAAWMGLFVGACQDAPEPNAPIGEIGVPENAEELRIGVADFPEEYILGSPRAVVTDTDRNILILDYFDQTIKKYSPDGKFLGKFGGDGEGPGEFRRPVRMTTPDGENLYALDNSLGFQHLDMDGGFLARATPSEELSFISDFCVLGNGNYLVHGRLNGWSEAENLTDVPLFHVLDSDGDLIESFGRIRPYEALEALVRDFGLERAIPRFASGEIACDPTNPRVYLAGSLHPSPVLAYTIGEDEPVVIADDTSLSGGITVLPWDRGLFTDGNFMTPGGDRRRAIADQKAFALSIADGALYMMISDRKRGDVVVRGYEVEDGSIVYNESYDLEPTRPGLYLIHVSPDSRGFFVAGLPYPFVDAKSLK